jgi:hypothetical protein
VCPAEEPLRFECLDHRTTGHGIEVPEPLDLTPGQVESRKFVVFGAYDPQPVFERHPCVEHVAPLYRLQYIRRLLRGDDAAVKTTWLEPLTRRHRFKGPLEILEDRERRPDAGLNIPLPHLRR